MSEEHKVEEPTGYEYIVKNRLQAQHEAIHGWYRFVLGYPPHLVSEYLPLLRADPESDWVADPFCGTATTPVESRLQGFSTLSADANPISILAARVKLNWEINVNDIQSQLQDVVGLSAVCMERFNLDPQPGDHQLSLFGPQLTRTKTGADGLSSLFNPDILLPQDALALIPSGFISPKPLLRVLALRYAIENLVHDQDVQDFLKLALANTIVKNAGNIGFGPEVYRLPPREDANVLGAFTDTVERMTSDLLIIQRNQSRPFPEARVFQADARNLSSFTSSPPIGIVITSPPYPNEKDYTRSTRLESVLLGLITNKKSLRAIKSSLLRSNTRNVFVQDNDDTYIQDIQSVVRVADEIEQTRIKLGKTSGFERLYHRVTRLYFGGMYLHLAALFPRLRPGARCAYVVGDQMSYFRIHIPTAKLLADVAVKAGYKVEGINLWRTRRSTTTGVDLEENVLILSRPT